MDQSRALDVIEREARRILQLTRPAEASDDGTSPEITTCPGWKLPDLANHVGRVYGWATSVLADDQAQQPDRTLTPRRPPEQSPSNWMEERLGILLPRLATISDTDAAWNFVEGAGAPASFWWHRQAHETLIHRVDAEVGARQPITEADTEVAVDGIDDFLLLARLTEVGWEDLQLGEGMTVHLHATDAEDAEWTIDTVNRSYARAHLKADVALRGAAWALDRWCWRRDLDGLDIEVFGDVQAAADWRPAI